MIISLLLASCSTGIGRSEKATPPALVSSPVQPEVERNIRPTQSTKARDEERKSRSSQAKKKSSPAKSQNTQVGEASYYGPRFHGKETASGETFNQNKPTAAHPTLPLGTEAEVTNLETGKSVEVEINDRGPFTDGRAIDLSKGAARKIGIGKKEGTAKVKVEASSQTEDKKK
ncbi:MAG: septal ring lytic transglycosylase RlpA family protein [Candidatus Binatia bacterium]